MDAPPGSAHVAAGPVNPPTPGVRRAGLLGRCFLSKLPLWAILVVLRPGGGGCGSPPVSSAEAQSAAARSVEVAWGRFRAQPGAAGDTCVRHIGPWGSSGVTFGTFWVPLGGNFHAWGSLLE